MGDFIRSVDEREDVCDTQYRGFKIKI